MRRLGWIGLVLALLVAVPARGATPNAWRPGPYFGEREAAGSTVLSDGRVMVAGGSAGLGRQSKPVVPMVEILDPRLGRWQAVGDITDAVPVSVALAPLLDGGALAVYARFVGSPPTFVTRSARFDPETNRWRTIDPPPTDGQQLGRGFPTTLKDGRVLLLRPHNEASSGSTDIYDPAGDSWAHVASPTDATGPLVVLGDGRVLAAGDSPALFDPGTATWTPTAPRPALSGQPQFAVLLLSGSVLVTGEEFADLYDPRLGTWKQLFRLRGFLPAGLAVMPDGRVLAPRGPAAWVIDPERGRFFTAASSRNEHAYGVVAGLPDGKVLLAGGQACNPDPDVLDACGSTSVVEIYQPPPPRPIVSWVSIAGRRRAPMVTFSLNEGATVRLTLERRTRGDWTAVRFGRRTHARAGRNRLGLAGRLDPQQVACRSLPPHDLLPRSVRPDGPSDDSRVPARPVLNAEPSCFGVA